MHNINNTVIIIYLLSVFLDFQFDGELEGRLDEIIQKVLLDEDFSDHYQCHSKERFIVL